MASAPEMRPSVGMGDAEFRLLAELLREHCGLHFGPESRYLLESRLGPRVLDLGLRSFSAYHYLLRNDRGGQGELGWAVDSLTTNETYFFRERAQLRALVEEILPEQLRERRVRGAGPVCVWSAGCSSGEEPYSVAILAREAGLEPERDLRIYASDISRRMLQRARRGLYGAGAFRETEPALRQRYFEPREGGHRILDEVKKQVHFTHLNLLDPSRMALLGRMDVILCRNVIIYFDLDTKRRVIEHFQQVLPPGGHLLLGHSESLVNLSSGFELRHLRHDLVYRKPLLESHVRERWHTAAQDALAATRDGQGGG